MTEAGEALAAQVAGDESSFTAIPSFQLGQRVKYRSHLIRTVERLDAARYGSDRKVWQRWDEHYPIEKRQWREGIIVGKRRLANGIRQHNGYDEPITFEATEQITAWLVAYDLRHRHVLVLAEDLLVLE